ncbi:MAG TPA: EAL domain-containing protein [Burkholderiales bacterium]|nr:EAL domain-containing protein [Burkholderiales bacterium]
MDSILIIEPSATLQYVLRRVFARMPVTLHVMASYGEAAERLKRGELSVQAVVVGLPPGPQSIADELFSVLNQKPCLDTAVLLVLHTRERQQLEWIEQRSRSAWLLWENHAECVSRIEQLLASPKSWGLDGNSAVRILLVDDARTVREAFRKLLRKHDYEVEVASNMNEALIKASKQPFDIAIVDYFMPGGNGDELCQRLRADPRTASITAAVLTATYVEEVIRRSLDAGAAECMFKDEAAELFLARLSSMSRSVRIKKSIEAERIRLSSILSSVGDGVYGVNRAGDITFVNPVACSILGYTEVDLVGASAHKLLHYAYEDGSSIPLDRCQLTQAYGTGEDLRDWETVFWRRTGKPVPVECTVAPFRVEGRLEGSVVAFRDVSERRMLERELIWQVNHDPLTKLPNRSYFERALDDEINRLGRSEERSALLFLDLDRFKQINDAAGHAAGDQLLAEISQQLRTRLRESDVLARLSGDEFAILLRNVHPERILQVADGFREVLSDYSFVFGGSQYQINGSIGVATIGRDGARSSGELLAHADLACHIAKGKGRNQTHLYQPDTDSQAASHLDLGWQTRLLEALKSDGFMLQFQPVVSLTASPGDAYHEALVRLRDAVGNMIYPGSFMSMAERFNLAHQLDIWVLTAVMRELAASSKDGRQRMALGVNLSGHTLGAANAADDIQRLLAQYQVDPRLLVFEITEAAALANLSGANRFIIQLCEIGCRFALDDFGTGFSSFHHLKRLPVDFIKIDGQFIQDMAHDPIDRAIVASINDVAHSFGKRTIAESVEDKQVLELLRGIGVDYVQGYYLARPSAAIKGED